MVFNEAGSQSAPEKEIVLVNPEIIAQSEETTEGEEGCLSFPMIGGNVKRHDWVEVSYQTLSGEKKLVKLDGRPAVIFQHEYDHLNKVTFTNESVNQILHLIKSIPPGLIH